MEIGKKDTATPVSDESANETPRDEMKEYCAWFKIGESYDEAMDRRLRHYYWKNGQKAPGPDVSY